MDVRVPLSERRLRAKDRRRWLVASTPVGRSQEIGFDLVGLCSVDLPTANQERKAIEEETTDTTEGTTAEDSDMSLGEAVNNMSRDVRGALSELFGSRTE